MEFSIIIPTFNHLQDFLIPCINSIKNNTNLSQAEVIIVANGCTDGTEEYVTSLGEPFKLISFKEPLGYTKAVNEGIRVATKPIIILMNNDIELLDPTWIKTLLSPFEHPYVGITGPVKFFWECGRTRREAIAFWLVAIRKKVFDEIGLFDETFSPGMGEDGDFCIKAKLAGYYLVGVPENSGNLFTAGLNNQKFPVIHKGSGTFSAFSDNNFIERNKKILEDRYSKPLKISIVIPTYNHLEDCLKPCLESIFTYTNMKTDNFELEIIIISNGSTDGTNEYLSQLAESSKHIKPLFFPEALGYPKATNEGIKISTGDYVLLLNNDSLIQESEKNHWINILLKPFFKYPNLGIAGPLMLHDCYSNSWSVIFFCALIKREVINKIGLLDESYGMGGGEDIAYCIETNRAGFTCLQIPEGEKLTLDKYNIGSYPMFHKGEGTMNGIPEYAGSIIMLNSIKNLIKYNPNIKLNLGSGGVDFPGYFSIDLEDPRALLKLDATDLRVFPDNTISEIIASHLLEHLNPYHSVDILKEWRRILKPGGKIIIEVPDMERLCESFATASREDKYGIMNCIYGSVNTKDNKDPSRITSSHLWGWYPEMLIEHLEWAGFKNIKSMPAEIPHPLYNFRCEAEK